MAESPKKPLSAPIDLAIRPPVMTILSDHPILRDTAEEKALAERENDAFELDARLGAVYDIIRHKNTRAPLAVGIFGDWGTGKSSAMRWLCEQLTRWSASGVDRDGHCPCRTVWFEPWKYQSREEVWRGLISEVVINSINLKSASVATVVSAVKRFGGALGRGFIHAVSALELKAGVPLAGEATVNLDALTKIAEDYQKGVHPEKAYLNEFESTLKEWVKGSLGNGERMVLFIDDLDRCMPGVVLEVLEALKLYLNVPQLIFVIGLDRDVVRAVIRKQYKDAGLSEIKADSYLDKIFQVEVEVPPSERRMDEYLDDQIMLLDRTTGGYWSNELNAGGAHCKAIIEGAIKKLALHNPREVKRLLNSTLLGGSAARRGGEAGNAANGTNNLRFAQGCQSYLISRVLRDNPICPASILREEQTWTFLVEWSKFIKRYPLYRELLAKTAAAGARELDANRAVATPKGADIDKPNEAELAWRKVLALLPRSNRDTRGPYPLDEVDHLWDLLEIECSADVGQTMAKRVTETRVAVQPVKVYVSASVGGVTSDDRSTGADAATTPDETLSKLPRIVLSRIAKHLRMAPEELTTSDIGRVAELDLSSSEFDDAGLKDLCRVNSGLKGLISLNLGFTRVTDAGLKELCRENTGLKGLNSLYLGYTTVTDAGLKELCRENTGLKGLTSLNLGSTLVTDVGLKDLFRKETGLKGLTSLYLGYTTVTSLGLKELCREETGLKGLTSLYLWNTKVTYDGVEAVQERWPKLKILR